MLYPKVSLLDGRAAHNPWLQELPDPVTKAVWDNYACLSPQAAERLGVRQESMVRITAGGASIDCPCCSSSASTTSRWRWRWVTAGWARIASPKSARSGSRPEPSVGPNGLVGVNAAVATAGGRHAAVHAAGRPRRSRRRKPALATTQQHHSLSVPEHVTPGTEHRPIVEQTT